MAATTRAAASASRRRATWRRTSARTRATSRLPATTRAAACRRHAVDAPAGRCAGGLGAAPRRSAAADLPVRAGLMRRGGGVVGAVARPRARPTSGAPIERRRAAALGPAIHAHAGRWQLPAARAAPSDPRRVRHEIARFVRRARRLDPRGARCWRAPARPRMRTPRRRRSLGFGIGARVGNRVPSRARPCSAPSALVPLFSARLLSLCSRRLGRRRLLYAADHATPSQTTPYVNDNMPPLQLAYVVAFVAIRVRYGMAVVACGWWTMHRRVVRRDDVCAPVRGAGGG